MNSNTSQKTLAQNSEQEAALEEIGSVVFESALLQYMAEVSEEEAAAFETFIEAHVSDEDLIGSLAAAYPRFGEILQAEMAVLQTELQEIISEEVKPE